MSTGHNIRSWYRRSGQVPLIRQGLKREGDYSSDARQHNASGTGGDSHSNTDDAPLTSERAKNPPQERIERIHLSPAHL
jgi:hypothetical protein